MEKEKMNGHTTQTNIFREKETIDLAGTAHHCCGKCRQQNEVLVKGCDKHAERNAARQLALNHNIRK